jgi:hypothetical protein
MTVILLLHPKINCITKNCRTLPVTYVQEGVIAKPFRTTSDGDRL